MHRKVGQFQTLQDYNYFPRSLLGEQRTKGIQEPPVLNGQSWPSITGRSYILGPSQWLRVKKDAGSWKQLWPVKRSELAGNGSKPKTTVRAGSRKREQETWGEPTANDKNPKDRLRDNGGMLLGAKGKPDERSMGKVSKSFMPQTQAQQTIRLQQTTEPQHYTSLPVINDQ